MRTVKVELHGSHAIPQVCVACGEPVGGQTVTAGWQNSKGSRFVSLNFPICDHCVASKKALQKANWGLLAALPAFVVAYGVVLVIGNAVAKDFAGCLAIVAALFAAVGAAVYARDTLNARTLPPEEIARARAAKEPVKITSVSMNSLFGKDSMVVRFNNDDYAQLFETANLGNVIR